MIPLPHSAGPPAMPTPVPGCPLCVRLDTARRAARDRGDQASADKFSGAYVKHHTTRHPGLW
ncbi:hypothetical protein GCM10010357_18830 [Streptomyces luteireticuli]|uniref:Uncharacterized protein n=1 Tax=Streptomyces luteireticuli TaxID=173858 RepID=A0ABP3ICZ6_9ACTN